MDVLLSARAGRPAAVAQLVESLRPRLVSLAAHYARRTGHDFADLLQEALCGVLAALPRVDACIGTPRQFLVHHARWRLLDFVRRTRPLAPLPPAADLVAPDGIDGADAAMDVAFLRARLTPAQRIVLDRLLAGDSWREAAAALGCTHAAIAYRVGQIRAVAGRAARESAIAALTTGGPPRDRAGRGACRRLQKGGGP